MSPSPSGGRTSRRQGAGPGSWASRPCSTGSSSTPCCRCYRRSGTPPARESSDGVRPQRSAHQAVGQAQAYIRAGYTWVVDIDLEQFFDRVNHDVLMSRVRRRVKDRRVVILIHRFLKLREC